MRKKILNFHKPRWKTSDLKGMVMLSLLFFVGLGFSNAQIVNPVADASIKAFNNTFLIKDASGETAYRRELGADPFDEGWTLALNIQGMLDAYERTGSQEHKAILDNLMKSFVVLNHPPYDWDGWNDDLAWIGLVLARSNKMIGNQELLTDAEYFFNLAYDRGWSTEFNDGGIWEQQPNFSNEYSSKSKDALSNNPTGHLACLLYETTGNPYYLDKAKQIYEWSVSHIFNPKNGHVYAGIYRNDYLNKSLTAYSQGSFIDFCVSLYNITGDEKFLRNAILATDYTISQLTTADGIVSTDSQNHNTWAGEFARGLGHLLKSKPELWNKYYEFLKKNSDVTWSNRRMDLDLTWNGWAIPTNQVAGGVMANIYISAVALHQHTPVIQSAMGTIQAENYNFWEGITPVSFEGGESIKLNNKDWVEYVVQVPKDGTYTISFDIAATTASSFEVQQDHISLGVVQAPVTSDFETYSSVSSSVKLKSGFHTIRFKAINGELNINQWKIENCDLIQPMISVNGGTAQAITEVTLDAGDDVLFSPEFAEGTWSWSGPEDFSASTREVSISNITKNKSGIYTVKYTNNDGCVSTKDFMVSLSGCIAPELTTKISIYKDGWEEIGNTIIDAGSFVKVTATPSNGNWSWTGPNGFTSEVSEITFNSIGYKEAGEYTGTYYDSNGCKNTIQVTLQLTGEDPCGSPITPFINIDGWREGAYGLVNAGGTFQVGPQATGDGSWSWTGPGGFTSNQREFTVSNFDQSKAGIYTASYTNQQGCVSTKEFVVGLEGCSSTSIIPQITVDGQPWINTNSISVVSGGSFTITPPNIGGQWNWTGNNNGGERYEGLYGFESNQRIISFNEVLDVRQGTLTLTHINSGGCLTSHVINVSVEGDDYCGSEVTPYINANNTGWTSSSTALLEKGQSFTVGPQLSNGQRAQWECTGPSGFIATGREFTITNIQPNQAGVYRLTATNNIGCVSSIEYNISVKDTSLGIDDLNKSSEVSFYPNPASDKIKLTNILANSTITIIDMNGKKLLSKSTNNDEEVEMNVSSLRSGVYFIVIKNQETKAKTLKMIKQ